MVLEQVRRFIRRHQLAGPETRVLAAVSGGSDSVALAHLVRELQAAGDCRAAGIVHFNHQLRETADRDEALTVALSESFGWPVVVERGDVAARARRQRCSIEAAARTARYECFERARLTLRADVVALGHTRDDQAETFLLRLIRGAGPTGLAAMHPRRGTIVRPLLSCRRGELQNYLAARKAAYAEDESNGDVTVPRNRVRAELLPLLAQRFNPAIVDTLANEADLAREIWQWMEQSVEALFPAGGAPEPTEGVRRLDVAAMTASPVGLQRFVIWKALSAGGRAISFAHVDAAIQLLGSETAGAVDVPGYTVQRLGPTLVLRSSGSAGSPGPPGAPTNFFDYPLSIPGEVFLPEAGYVLAAECPEAFDPGSIGPGGEATAVRRDLCSGQWRVRNRRSGDRFRPVGLGGRKTLQDLFIDRKVPRHRRDAVPLVVDGDDRIVWVAGFGIDEAFRVTDAAQAVIILRLKLLGGSA